jgi:hypothetical protein
MYIGRPSPTVFWGKEGETSVLFPGMKAGNVYVTADGSLKMKGLVVENSGKIGWWRGLWGGGGSLIGKWAYLLLLHRGLLCYFLIMV